MAWTWYRTFVGHPMGWKVPVKTLPVPSEAHEPGCASCLHRKGSALSSMFQCHTWSIVRTLLGVGEVEIPVLWDGTVSLPAYPYIEAITFVENTWVWQHVDSNQVPIVMVLVSIVLDTMLSALTGASFCVQRSEQAQKARGWTS